MGISAAGYVRWRTFVRSDPALAAFTAALAFAIYVRTLLPDVGGPEDTPKFQYLGAVLGTAHPPGYPLHTLLSHLFSQLPIGTIAYRANLLSAVAGGVAVFFAVLLGRAVGSSRAAAVLGALTVAFGAAFWNYAVLAEVYTLSAALLLAVMFWLVRWSNTGRDADLFCAALCFALALGNHLVIVAAAPAIAAFLLLTNGRRVLRVRTLVPAALIALSGFLQYSYILIRTRQGTPYREASATTLVELLNVIRASEYRDYVFAFSWHELVTIRMHQLGTLLHAELRTVGLILAALGLSVLFARRWRVATLLALTFLATTALVVNMFGELRGFLVIPVVMAAPFLAVGGDTVRDAFGRLGRVALATATVLLVSYPIVPLRENFSANDWSERTGEARFLRTWFQQLPARAAVLPEDYVTDAIVTYLQIESGNHGLLLRPPGHVASVRQAFESGERVYAMDARYAELSLRGFDFDAVEVPITADAAYSPTQRQRHVYRLTALLQTIAFGDAHWHDLTPVTREGMIGLTVDNYRPFDADVVLYATADVPLRPVILRERLAGTGDPTVSVQHYDRDDPGSLAQFDAALARDAGAATLLDSAGRYAARIEHRVNDDGNFAGWPLALGAIPRRVIGFARPDRPHESRAIIAELAPARLLADRGSYDLTLGTRADRLLGAGWHLPEKDGEGEFRWTASKDAQLLLPLATVKNVVVTARVMGRPSSDARLVVNGRELDPCALTGGWQSCTWRLPADTSRVGMNQITLRSSVARRPSEERQAADSRVLGMAVRSIRLGPAS